MCINVYLKVMIVATSAEKNGIGSIAWKECWGSLYIFVVYIVTVRIHSRITMYNFLNINWNIHSMMFSVLALWTCVKGLPE